MSDANRKFITESVMLIDREWNAVKLGSVSQDSMIVWYRKLLGLRPLAEQESLPTTKIDDLMAQLRRKAYRDLTLEPADAITIPQPAPPPPPAPDPRRGGSKTNPMPTQPTPRPKKRTAPTGPANPVTPPPEPEPDVPHRSPSERKESVKDLFGEIL